MLKSTLSPHEKLDSVIHDTQMVVMNIAYNIVYESSHDVH